MKFNAQTARQKTDSSIEAKKAQEIIYINEIIDSLIVPQIEEAISGGYYVCVIKKEGFTDCAIKGCYTILKQEGFIVENYDEYFFLKW